MTQSRARAISVVIPTYNCAKFLTETIQSVAEQLPPPLEILVIDDGSTDETPAVAAAFGSRIRFVSIPHSGRPSVPRNVGLRLASGDLVAIFDADDIMLPGKLAAAQEVFDSRPEISLLFTDFQSIDERGRMIESTYLQKYRAFRQSLVRTSQPDLYLVDGHAMYRQLLHANFIGTSSVVARRHVLLDAGGFSEELTNSDDIDLWYRVSRSGARAAFLDRVFHRYRVRPGSVSSKGSRMYPSIVKVLEDQLPHVDDPILQRTLRRRISGFRLDYAWHLGAEGHLRLAGSVCLRELRAHPSWRAFRQLLRVGHRALVSGL